MKNKAPFFKKISFIGLFLSVILFSLANLPSQASAETYLGSVSCSDKDDKDWTASIRFVGSRGVGVLYVSHIYYRIDPGDESSDKNDIQIVMIRKNKKFPELWYKTNLKRDGKYHKRKTKFFLRSRAKYRFTAVFDKFGVDSYCQTFFRI